MQDLVGSWVDKPVLNNQAGEIVIRLLDAGDSSLIAELDLPRIDAWAIPVGKAQIYDDGIQIGSKRFSYDRDDNSVYVGSVGVRGYIVDHRPGFFRLIADRENHAARICRILQSRISIE